MKRKFEVEEAMKFLKERDEKINCKTKKGEIAE
jgi:hypothetical protein